MRNAILEVGRVLAGVVALVGINVKAASLSEGDSTVKRGLGATKMQSDGESSSGGT